jgi:hypothetical protein
MKIRIQDYEYARPQVCEEVEKWLSDETSRTKLLKEGYKIMSS